MNTNSAFTRTDLLGVITCASLAVLLALTARSDSKFDSQLASCANNLRQVSQGFRSYAIDHKGLFPWDIYSPEGSRAMPNTFQQFLLLSQHITNPKIFVCPADGRAPQTNYATLINFNISYFNALHTFLDQPRNVLSGDSDINGLQRETCNRMGPGGDAWAFYPTSITYTWGSPTRTIHGGGLGNIGFSDGSVVTTSDQQLNTIACSQSEKTHFLLPE